MSVSPIGSAGVSPLQQSPPSQGNWQSVLNTAAGTLGLSTTALQQQLQSGQSLGSIAQSKGVSQQTLSQSISSACRAPRSFGMGGAACDIERRHG